MPFALATVTSWADLKTLEMLPLQVARTHCSLGLHFLLTSHSAVFCSGSPLPSSLLWTPMSKCAPPPVTLSMLFPTLVLTTHLLICDTLSFSSTGVQTPWRQESRDSTLNPDLPAVRGASQVVGSDVLSEESEWGELCDAFILRSTPVLETLDTLSPWFPQHQALLFQMGKAWDLLAFTDPLCYVHHMLQSFWMIFTRLHVLAFVLANPSA